MIIMLAVDNNWSIGHNGKMLFNIEGDMKRFKEITTGNIVIMGRKTYESLPKKNRPLPNRDNIVFSRNNDYKLDHATVVHTVEELEKVLEEINGDKSKKEFVIGGGEIVDLLIDRCNKAYITRVDADYELRDAYIRDLNEDENWKVINRSDIEYEQGLVYRFVEFERV